MDSQPDHHSGITDVAAALNAKAKLSLDYDIRHLLPTSRSQITYSFDDKNHVLMPDASFQLSYKGTWRTYFLEFEATRHHSQVGHRAAPVLHPVLRE